MDRKEVLGAIARGELSSNSREVAQAEISPQEIVFPVPRCWMGACPEEVYLSLSLLLWDDLFPGEPHPLVVAAEEKISFPHICQV